MSLEALYSVRILTNNYDLLSPLSDASGKSIAHHILKGTLDWMNHFPNSVVPPEVENVTQLLHGPETLERTIYDQKPEVKKLICKLGGGAIEWHEEYSRLHFYQTARDMGGIPSNSNEEFLQFVRRMPRPLDLPTIIRAGVKNEIAQCRQSDFPERLQAAHAENAAIVDQLLRRRRR